MQLRTKGNQRVSVSASSAGETNLKVMSSKAATFYSAYLTPTKSTIGLTCEAKYLFLKQIFLF